MADETPRLHPELFRAWSGKCFQCKQPVTRILDLRKTKAPLCSLECEKDYWLDIFW